MADESKPVEALGLVQLIVKLGAHLDYEVATEVPPRGIIVALIFRRIYQVT